MSEKLVALEDVNALRFGVLCNFAPVCGEERAKEAADIILRMKNELKEYRALGTIEEFTTYKGTGLEPEDVLKLAGILELYKNVTSDRLMEIIAAESE